MRLNTLSTLLCTFIVHTTFAVNYYVSPNGDDTNSGTSAASPVKSISAVNNFTLTAGDSLLFERNGEYQGELILKYSGSSGKNIVIADYDSGNKPVFTGSRDFKISSGTSIYCPSCVEYDNLITHQDKILIPARYPNTGYLTMSETTGHTSFKSTDLTGVSSSLAEALVVVKTESWVIDRFPVSSFSGTEIQVGSTLGFHTPYDFKKFNGFFLSHDKSFLDQDSEWYFDASTKYLYVNSSAVSDIRISEYDNGISIQKGCSYISVKNIVFKEYRIDGISLNDNNKITVEHCEFYNLGNDGIGGIKSWSSLNNNISVSNCIFKNTLNSAVNLLFGDAATISYNTVSNAGLIPGQGMMQDFGYCGINAPKNSTIEWNKIDSAGYSGVNLGSANNSEVRYNEVSNFGLTKNDCGGIYCWSAHDLNIHHNYVRNGHGNGEGTNYMSEIMNSGIYLDDKSYNNIVKYNTVKNCYEGMKLHNAYTNTIQYNNLYNNTKVQLTLLEGYPYYGAILKGNIISYNNLQSIHPASYLAELFSAVGVITNFAVFDDNTYNNPYNSKQIFLEYVPSSSTPSDHQNEFLSFGEWQSKYSQDANSAGTFDAGLEYGTPSLGTNLILNSTFDAGTGWWWDYGNSDFSYSVTNRSGFTGKVLKTAYASTKFSASHLGTSGFSLAAGKEYLLSFKTEGTKNGYIKLALSRSSEPYIPMAINEILGVKFSTSINEHSIPFKVGLSSQTSLQFHSTSTDGSYYIDDVVLQELTYDTTASTPLQYTQLFVNNSATALNLGIPSGFVYQSGEKITSSIILAPYTSIILKQDKFLSVFTENTADTETITIFPNPTESYLSVNYPNAIPQKLSITTISGELIKQTSSFSNKLYVGDLAAGMYLITMEFNDKKILTAKFLKK